MDSLKPMELLKASLAWPWPARLTRIALGLIFAYAGLVKLFDVEGFGRIIAQYDLAPEGLIRPLAVGLPVLEVLVGSGLVANVRGSLTAAAGLLVMFAFALYFGVLHDLDIDCGCFSTAEAAGHDSLRQALYRDLSMLAAAGYVFLHRRILAAKRLE